MKNDIKKRFKLKGEDIINKNIYMLEHSLNNLIKIDIPSSWKTLADKIKPKTGNEFVDTIMNPVLALRGDDLPVSTF